MSQKLEINESEPSKGISTERLYVANKGNKRGKHTKELNFSFYLHKVLTQLYPYLDISKSAMLVMNNFMHDIFKRLATEASELSRRSNRATLTASNVRIAARLLLPGNLAKHGISEGDKALRKFKHSM